MKYTRAEFEALFNSFDFDQSKTIEYMELHSFLSKHGMQTKPELLREYFQKFDKDSNGKLDVDEWCKMMEQVFK
ncbi:Conserved_hypothetical protein [Hexamita inflata]|uniref:EF-hand domain-containing protein n=1 Tax=Hexamita inflata TaxID=28002 RepID=A0AA86UHU0_9EUKA|nr:Conserved hypothetical protein [Hexamita inflata]CAI9958750.1 Conserved hypothetical protein [Hexamita inflata]CAI9960376.1 Conserved hypothetical protein [Hexamita inflata]